MTEVTVEIEETEETPQLGNPSHVLQKLIDRGIDLSICEISADCAPRRYVHYLDSWKDNEDPHIQLTFHHQTLSPENRRDIKRLTGQLKAGEGSSPPLFGEIMVEGIRVEFKIQGSYECQTFCTPKGDFADVRDELLSPVALEEDES